MKLTLITTPTRTYLPNTVLPVGIMYLTSYLEENGHSVEIIDIAKTRQENQKTIEAIGRYKPDLIGIGGIITAYRFIKELVGVLKKAFPDVPIVVGGHVTIDTIDILLKKVGCDYTASGYGEKTLLYLMEYLEGKRNLKDIPALSYKEKESVITNPGYAFFSNMDDIPMPSYEKVDMEYYVTVTKRNPKLEKYIAKTLKPKPPMRTAVVIGARGCTDKCSFCVHEFEYKKFYMHSMEYLVKNIKILYEEYGVRIFGIGEDLFLFNSKQASELARIMNEQFPDAYFACSTRADYVTKEFVNALRNSNCFFLGYGFESANNDILKILGKRMTREINVGAYKNIRNAAITPGCSFMVGSPGETKKTIDETISAIKEANILDSAVFVTTPYPGSRLFRWCLENKLIEDVEAYLEFISDRDAFKLSVNFTPFPNIIVKMMKIMVQNAWEDNKYRVVKGFKVSFKRLVVYHWIVPILYESYFLLRRILAIFFPKYRKDTLEIELNEKHTVKLSTDKHDKVPRCA